MLTLHRKIKKIGVKIKPSLIKRFLSVELTLTEFLKIIATGDSQMKRMETKKMKMKVAKELIMMVATVKTLMMTALLSPK